MKPILGKVTSFGKIGAKNTVSVPTVIYATVTNVVMGTNGRALQITFSANVTHMSTTGFKLSGATIGSDVQVTYISGTGTNVGNYTIAPTAQDNEVLTLNYSKTGNNIIDSDFREMFAFTNKPVTNNSTQVIDSAPPSLTNVSVDPGDASADYYFQSNEDGIIYFLALPAATAIPTAEWLSNNALDVFCTANALETYWDDSLVNGTAYRLHVAAKDEADNLSAVTTTGPFTPSVAATGASIEVDFVGLGAPYTYEISNVDPAGTISEDAGTSPGIAYSNYPVMVSELPFNTLVEFTIKAWNAGEFSTSIWSMWTSPETTPTLTLGTPTENTVPFAISGTAPASEETESGYVLEMNEDGAGWVDANPSLVAWDGDLTQSFIGLTGNTPYQFRVRAINVQPNTDNDPSYSAWSTPESAITEPDIQEPIIVSATVTPGDEEADISITYDENTTVWWSITTDPTESAADIKAHTGALDWGTYSGTANVAHTETTTGLTNGVTYYLHVVAEDVTPNQSAVTNTAGFTPVNVFTVMDLENSGAGELVKLWLDSSDTITLLDASDVSAGDNVAIKTWTDKSGKGNNASQATVYKPVRTAAAQNGLDGVKFNAEGTQSMGFASAPLSGATAAFVCYVVKRLSETPSGGAASAGPIGDWGTHDLGDLYPYTDDNIYDGFCSTARKTIGDPTLALADARIITIKSAAGAYVYQVDDETPYTTASNTVGIGTTPTLGKYTSANWYYNGYILEVVALNFIPTTQQVSDLKSYLTTKWGIV